MLHWELLASDDLAFDLVASSRIISWKHAETIRLTLVWQSGGYQKGDVPGRIRRLMRVLPFFLILELSVEPLGCSVLVSVPRNWVVSCWLDRYRCWWSQGEWYGDGMGLPGTYFEFAGLKRR